MRTRLIGVAAAVAFVVGGTLALDRWVGPSRSAGAEPAAPLTGAWLCPHGGGEGWRAWVVLANPGPAESRARVSTYSDGEPVVADAALLPGTHQYVEVPARTMAAGTMVERFGGPLAAGWVLERPEGGLAAEPCAARGGRHWYAVGATAERAERGWVVLVNPFAADAVAGIELHLAERALRPGELRGIVVPARRAVAVELNPYALGEPAIAAIVEVGLGRLAAGVVEAGDDSGLSSAVAAPSLARAWTLPGAADDGPSILTVAAPAGEVPFTVQVEATGGQSQALTDAGVGAARSAAHEIAATGAGVFIASEGRAAMAAARRTSLSIAGDAALTGGRAVSAASWVVPPGLPPEGGRSFVVIENPEPVAARAAVTMLTAGGAAPVPGTPVDIPPGTSVALELTEPAGGLPTGILVQALSGSVVAAQASITASGYSVSSGLRIP